MTNKSDSPTDRKPEPQVSAVFLRALENRHETRVRWGEPWKACGPEGNDLDAHVTLEASVHDCINLARASAKAGGHPTMGEDLQHLEEFVVVHWAQIVEKPETPPKCPHVYGFRGEWSEGQLVTGEFGSPDPDDMELLDMPSKAVGYSPWESIYGVKFKFCPLCGADLAKIGLCIGDGCAGGGCGYRGGKAGDTCPKCGGMVLDEESTAQADDLAKSWEKGEE